MREARIDAGLSLRELAAGRISRTALHLIETGRTRPTQPTLELIAERTGKPLRFFLEPGEEELLAPPGESRDVVGELIELELELERGMLGHAADLAAPLIAGSTGGIRAIAHVHAGQAHLGLGQPEQARAHVAEALAFYTETDDQPMVAECLDWQAAIQHQTGDPAAIETAERALRLSEQVRPIPIRTRVRILSRIGSIRASQRRWAEAIRAYEAAVSAGSALHDLSRVGEMYSELSIAYRRLNRLADARRHELHAVHVHQLLNDRILVAQAETNLALALMRLGQLEEARTRLERALSIFDAERAHRERAHVLLAIANLHLQRQELDEAHRFAELGRKQARRMGERVGLAEANEILKRIASMRKRPREPDRRFRPALSVRRATRGTVREVEEGRSGRRRRSVSGHGPVSGLTRLEPRRRRGEHVGRRKAGGPASANLVSRYVQSPAVQPLAALSIPAGRRGVRGDVRNFGHASRGSTAWMTRHWSEWPRLKPNWRWRPPRPG